MTARRAAGATRAPEPAGPDAVAPSGGVGNALRTQEAAGAAGAAVDDPMAALASVDGGGGAASGGAAPPSDSPITPDVVAQQSADVTAIVDALKEQVLTASDEGEIVERLRAWRQADEAWRSDQGGQGAPHVDRILMQLKARSFPRSTAATGWIETWVNAYDILWDELEDDRLTDFQAIIQGSRQATSGPESAAPESLWGTMGQALAMGGVGMVEGLASGVAGIADGAATGITKVANLVGDETGAFHLTDPTSMSGWIEGQYDIIGDAAFGDAWKHDNTLGGASAGQIGLGGGKILAALTMMGAGTAMSAPGAAGSLILPAGEAAVAVNRALAALGALGALGTVAASAQSIAADITRVQGARGDAMRAEDVIGDREFQAHAAALASGIFAAVASGAGMRAPPPPGTAPPSPLLIAGITAFLESAGAVVEIGRMVDANQSTTLSEAEKDRVYRAALEAFFTKLANAVGGLAAVRDAHVAEQANTERVAAATEEAARVQAAAEASADPATVETTSPEAPGVELEDLSIHDAVTQEVAVAETEDLSIHDAVTQEVAVVETEDLSIHDAVTQEVAVVETEELAPVDVDAEELTALDPIIEEVAAADTDVEELTSLDPITEEIAAVDVDAEELTSLDPITEEIAPVDVDAEELTALDPIIEEVAAATEEDVAPVIQEEAAPTTQEELAPVPDAAALAAAGSGVFERWGSLSADERVAALVDLAGGDLSRIGAPALMGVVGAGGSSKGELNFAQWEVMITHGLVASDAISAAQFGEALSTTVHEVRHAEQWFRMAQQGAASGMTPEQIAAKLGVPDEVAIAAWEVQTGARPGEPLRDSGPLREQADAWEASVYGADAAHRADVYARMDATRAALEQANAARQARGRSAATDQAVADAHAAFLEAYEAYRALPEEADAWAAGDAAGLAMAQRQAIEARLAAAQADAERAFEALEPLLTAPDAAETPAARAARADFDAALARLEVVQKQLTALTGREDA